MNKLLRIFTLCLCLAAGIAAVRGETEIQPIDDWDDLLYRLTGLSRTMPARTDRTPLQPLKSANSGLEADTGKININTATATELRRLPRIGEKTARKIIEYRTAHHGFKSIREITNVPRIGESMFGNMKHLITVGSPARRQRSRPPAAAEPRGPAGPVNINTATREQLMQLPWIGPGAAEKIIQFRNLNGRFYTVDELLNVPGMKPVILDQIRDWVRAE